MSFFCKAPRDGGCTFWDHGKACESCQELNCMDLGERYDLEFCNGTKPTLYEVGHARRAILDKDDLQDPCPRAVFDDLQGYIVECPACLKTTKVCESAEEAVWEWNDGNSLPPSKVITLCGSTKFKDQFLEIQKQLTLEGHIVLSVGLFGHSGDNEAWDNKKMLDALHKRKIAMSDEIFVINVGGYIGESTAMEIAFAEKMGKTVRYLEEKKDG